MKHIVIIGAGFGGLYTLKFLQKAHLNDAKITLISNKDYFLFTPLLHEVATAGLSTRLVKTPIGKIINCNEVDFVLGNASNLNIDDKYILVNGQKIDYDVLVIATGSKTDFKGITGAQKYSVQLKDLRDAQDIKKRALDAKNINIVGGGLTGVEITAELAEYIKTKSATIRLIHAHNNLIDMMPKKHSEYAKRYLKKLGVKVVLNSKVIQVQKDKINVVNTDSEQKTYRSDLTIWTAGVTPNIPKVTGNVSLTNDTRISVNKHLQLTNYYNVFALGDVAGSWPQLAQVAEKQAIVVAKNVKKLVENKAKFTKKEDNLIEYKYKLQGLLASLGSKNAIAKIYSFEFSGRVAWFIWRTIYLFKNFGIMKKFEIACEWTFSLFFKRRW